MENGTLLVDVALAIRMLIPMCENVKSQNGNCLLLASQLRQLKLLFDELRQSKFPLSEQTVSAFEQLHAALHKAKEMVSRCNNPSKIYSVLRSPELVSEFQELSRDMEHIVSSANVVLPRVSRQSQVLAEKCIQVLRSANFTKDNMEDHARQEIEALLIEHRGGRKASHEKLKQLAGYIGINTKEEISEELSALERARSEARQRKHKKEEDYIDQIISLFMQLAEDDFDNTGGDTKPEQNNVQIPTDFRCPLSLELMYDPVIVASGQTYERAYIQHWLDQGNTRCPKTGKPLAHTNLIPNFTVKALIASWCQTNGVPLPKVDAVKPENWLPPTFPEAQESQESLGGDILPTKLESQKEDESSENQHVEKSQPSDPVVRLKSSSTFSGDLSCELEAFGLSPSRNSPDQFPIFTRQTQSKQQRKSFKEVYIGTDEVAEASIERLIQELQSSDPNVQRDAAGELRLLAKNKEQDRIRIVHAGGTKYLVDLLDSPDSKTQENAVTALLNLSLHNNNKSYIAESGAIEPLIKVLSCGTTEARENAAATLLSLSVKDEYKEAIAAHGAIPPLVELLQTGTPRGRKDAATALYNLSLLSENKPKIIEAGAVGPLIDLICEPRMGIVDRAVVVLATLSTVPEGREAIGGGGGIPPLVEVVEAGSSFARENAAAALYQLCTQNPRYRNVTLQEGAVPPLYVLSQTGTSRAKEKAAGILRLFREQRQATMSRHHGNRHM